ncbi:MAG: hypothetical protein ACXWMN_04335 [Candidatus Limnocylindria bacterium]
MTTAWADREQLILDAIVNWSEPDKPKLEDLASLAGLDFREAQEGVRNLFESDYLTGFDVSNLGVGFDLIEIRLVERGLRATGAWPSDPYDEFLRAVQAAIARSSDAAERSRLAALLEAIKGVGTGVATAVITDVVKRAAGIP